jgi:hypothetical protein
MPVSKTIKKEDWRAALQPDRKDEIGERYAF